MQTFLPYPDFARSAACLDYRRLGKQRVECFQIIKALTDPDYGWQNHPAVSMWRGYRNNLGWYMNECIAAWVRRGYINNMEYDCPGSDLAPPPWFGNERFHSSHRAALLAKDPAWYGQFGWNETPQIDYWWPTNAR